MPMQRKDSRSLAKTSAGCGISSNGQYFVGTSLATEHSINGMNMESFIYNTKDGNAFMGHRG